MVIFKEKNFGFISDTAHGAAIGATIGGGVTKFHPITRKVSEVDKKGKVNTREVTLSIKEGALGGAIIGAALGFLAASIKAVANHVNKKRTVNARLLPDVVKRLNSMGHKEGMSFTRDPKRADMMRAKVSIVVYKYSDDLRLIVNTVDDSKLSAIMKQMTEKIARSNTSTFKEEISGKFKDLMITAISDSSTDADYIAWIATNFINNGYPVYLVEVG